MLRNEHHKTTQSPLGILTSSDLNNTSGLGCMLVEVMFDLSNALYS